MLGKGLESLIPPQGHSDDDGGLGDGFDLGGAADEDGTVAGEPVQQAQGLPRSEAARGEPVQQVQGRHEHVAPQSSSDFEPQILSFDFVGDKNLKETEEYLASKRAPHDIASPARNDVSSGWRSQGGQAAPDVFAAPANEPRENVAKMPNKEISVGNIYHIEISKIKPNPNQPRKNFSEEGIAELARSVREFGFLQPLVVSRLERETETGIDIEYQLIAGERRFLAAKLLGLEHVPAIVRNVDLEREKLELAVIENIQREDLSPIERARAFQRLQEEFRMTQREIAAKLGKSRETVANTVRLLDLPAYIQEALEKGQITESHGRFLLQIVDPSAQKNLFDDIVLRGLTTRDVKRRVRREKTSDGGADDGAAEVNSPELKALEEKLTAELGTPVRIERGENTGKITITFYSDEELQQILKRFEGELT